MRYIEVVLYPILQSMRVPAMLIFVKLLCFLLCLLGCGGVCRGYDASIRLSALTLTTRMRFVGSTICMSNLHVSQLGAALWPLHRLCLVPEILDQLPDGKIQHDVLTAAWYSRTHHVPVDLLS